MGPRERRQPQSLQDQAAGVLSSGIFCRIRHVPHEKREADLDAILEKNGMLVMVVIMFRWW